MDLSKAEKTLKNLEENSRKVEILGETVSQLDALQKELKSLPDEVQKQNLDVKNKILELEKEITKKIEKVSDDVSSIKKTVKSSSKETVDNLAKMTDEANERQKAIENSFETFEIRMGELSKKRELQIHSVKSSVTVLTLIALVILGVLGWSVFDDKFI